MLLCYCKHIDYIGLFREYSEHFSVHLISILFLHLIVQKKQVGCLKILQIIQGIRICNRIFFTSMFIETTAAQSNSCHEITNPFFSFQDRRTPSIGVSVMLLTLSHAHSICPSVGWSFCWSCCSNFCRKANPHYCPFPPVKNKLCKGQNIFFFPEKSRGKKRRNRDIIMNK